MVVDSQSILITRIFWGLFSLEAVACAGFLLWSLYESRRWERDGAVGAWLIFVVPPILLGIPLAVVLIGRSKSASLAGLCVLCWPLIMAVVGPVYTAFDRIRSEHASAGDFTFLQTSQRQLAHALRAHDAALVRMLLPKAGDLNAKHGGESLFGYALKNADRSSESLEIVRAMLDTGANANAVLWNDYWPLTAAISNGPQMTQLMMDAGANPNQTDDAGRPLWWNVLYDDSPEGRQTLSILLDHGADVALRDHNGGPVGWAAYLKNWRAVWPMIERGAAWKGEVALDQPIPQELDWDLAYRRSNGMEVPVEMEKVMAKYAEEASHR